MVSILDMASQQSGISNTNFGSLTGECSVSFPESKFWGKSMTCKCTTDIRVTTHLENREKSGNSKVVREKSGEVKSGVFFQAL